MDRVVRRHRTIPCEQGDPEVARSIYIKVEAELAGGPATHDNIHDLERTRPMLVLVALFVLALVGAMAIMLVSLYLSHGMGGKTTAAVVGTAVAGPLHPRLAAHPATTGGRR